MGVTDPEHILKTTRKIRRSQSLPSLCDPDQLDGSSPSSVLRKEEETSPWLNPIIPDSSFQVFTDPQSFRKDKTVSPGKIPLFQLKVGKNPFQPSSSQTSPSPKLVILKMEAQNQPIDMMDRMVVARYASLVLPHPLNALPGGDYQKYLPRFNGQGETTAEEH